MFRLVELRHKREGMVISALGGVGAALAAEGFRGTLDLIASALFWATISYAWQPPPRGAIDEQKPGIFRCRLRRVGWLLAAVAIPLWLLYGQQRYVSWVVRACGLLGIVFGSLPC
jgi:hypothetical protein